MNDTKLQDPAASNASGQPSPESAAPVESSCCAGNAHVPPRQAGVYAPITVDPPTPVADSQLTDFTAFLKRTWRIWAMAIGAFVGLLLLVALLQRLTEMAKAAEQKRYERAIASVTPEHLIARCGAPVEDVTKEVFPVVMRTVRYDPGRNEKLLFTFSRTDEQQSDWVFLTMKDENGTLNLDTPESKILAFPCLDSTK